MIPPFETDTGVGFLPEGIHHADWEEFESRFRCSVRRRKILKRIILFSTMMKKAGCKKIYIDGSFVTDKRHPNDWDGCFCTCGLNYDYLDPILLDLGKNRSNIQDKYMCDIFPDNCLEGESGMLFLDFFQQKKGSFSKKGIILLNLDSIP
ncbi:DUF6932 family protein [Gluconobacter kondonii]|uniref:DUF6932 family protein n=1 Tax=Gluconobacter kondonii TaxID=941463 RepID=UPI001B8D24B9|nr:hypothetical protein [Gluconobacter kondonii]MBS1055022.1 hypothetical protein [Gluconobacter kondonii]